MHYDGLVKEKTDEADKALEKIPLIKDGEGRSSMIEEFETRANAVVARKKQKAPEPPVQLPFWPEPSRAIPNELLRSALFSSSRRSEYVKDAPVASWPNTEISFTGARLNQFDETIWLQLVHLYRIQNVGPDHHVHAPAKGVLRDLGLKGGGSGIARLERSINRLMGAVVTFRRGQEMLKLGGPVQRFFLDEATGEYAVKLNPDFLRLLDDGLTQLDWETRNRLPTGLATWLHRYVLSHQATKRKPHRINLDRLRELSGMSSPPKEFKRTLKRTMELLEKHGIVEGWRITPNEALEFYRPSRRRGAACAQ